MSERFKVTKTEPVAAPDEEAAVTGKLLESEKQQQGKCGLMIILRKVPDSAKPPANLIIVRP